MNKSIKHRIAVEWMWLVAFTLTAIAGSYPLARAWRWHKPSEPDMSDIGVLIDPGQPTVTEIVVAASLAFATAALLTYFIRSIFWAWRCIFIRNK